MYEVIQVKWEPEFQNDIKEIYRMFKDQERKIFDLTTYFNGTDIMDLVEDMCKEDFVFLIKEGDTPCGVFILESPQIFGKLISRVNIHCAIRRPYWGAKAREICKLFRQFLHDNYLIKKIIAEVPQCGYGVIKLLKDMGFKHEGTMKEATIYKDKNGKPKFYDALIYSLTREDIK
jgi:RimJ/RimL family protein N-acetyltransferase